MRVSTLAVVDDRRLYCTIKRKDRDHNPSTPSKWSSLLVVVLLLGASCGKVGDPKPPFIHIPERIRDLTVAQSAYDVVLNWTNPAHNLDGSNADDLATVHITSAGASVADIKATGAGKPQAFAVPALNWLGQSRTFNVWLETTRHKTSEIATVAAHPSDVPGAVLNLTQVVDQYAITLNWKVPEKNGNLAEGYFVHRTDQQTPPVLTDKTQFQDSSFSYGKRYTYEVVAARQVDAKWITGVPIPPITLTAADTTAPQTPTGLAIVVTDTGAIVTWDVSPELDLKGYFVFKNGRKVNPAEPQTGNSFPDPNYQPNSSYSVSAIDEFGNESRPSAPIS